MASTPKKKSPMRGVMWAALATAVGLAMVVGGVYGIIGTYTDDDDDDSPSTSVRIVPPPSADFSSIGATQDCDNVDPRLGDKESIPLEPVRSKGSGSLTVRCGGSTAFFRVDVKGADRAEQYLFAELWAYNSSKDAVKLGTAFYRGDEITGLAGIPGNVDLKDYKSLVLVSREITDNSGKPRPIAFRATL